MSNRITNGQPTQYPVEVDFGSTFEQMVEAGRYDWKNSYINPKNFPVKGERVVEINLELVHLNKVASTDEVEAYFDANGFRSATLEELLAFGATYPHVQCEFPVVAIGSSWVNPLGGRGVPHLDGNGSERILTLRWHGIRWGELCRFLRKKSL